MTEETKTTPTSPIDEIKPKSKLTGKVAKTTLAGVLVDLGLSLPGVIHVSQLSTESIKSVDEVVTVGQEIQAWVKKVKADRIELSMIEPVQLDWKEMQPEQIVKGKVIRLEAYGAFVEIGAEKPGLVHVSEMGHGYVKSPGDVVKEGDEIDVMIIDIDRKKKQIRLSMKALLPEPEVTEEKPRSERPRGERKGKGGKRRDHNDNFDASSIMKVEDTPTAFESAWQAAMEKSQLDKSLKMKSKKDSAESQDSLLDRTLQNRVKTN